MRGLDGNGASVSNYNYEAPSVRFPQTINLFLTFLHPVLLSPNRLARFPFQSSGKALAKQKRKRKLLEYQFSTIFM